MSGFWAIFWIIIKYSLIIGVSLGTLALLIIIFHPICFSLKGRGSLKGQRGEVLMSYLFGLLRLRYIATVHTQDLWFEFGWFKKLLQRDSVRGKREEVSIEKREDDKANGEKSNVVSETLEEKVEEKRESEEEDREKVEEKREEEPKEKDIIKEDSAVSKTLEEKGSEEEGDITVTEAVKKEEIEEDKIEKVDEDDTVSETIKEEEVLPKVEATPEQLAELQNILEEEEKKEAEKIENKGNDLSAKFRKFKKDFDRRYKQIRSKIRLVKSKWGKLWPIVKRFWNRGKKGFKLYGGNLKIKYSFEDYCLTGMFYGCVAPSIGFVKRYGVNFMPIPVFPEQPSNAVYSKASFCLDIKPYRLIWAVCGLLFEKEIYKEVYQLLKKKYAKKRTEN